MLHSFFILFQEPTAIFQKLTLVRVRLDEIEMVAGDATTADEGEPDLSVNNHMVVMHRKLIAS